jgi:hypothetical protein
MSTIDIRHHVSEHDVHLAIYFSGPRPQALGIDHTFGAVPRTQLGDGCVRRQVQFEERCVRGLIPQTRLEYLNVSS